MDRDDSADGLQLEVMVRATDPSGDPQVGTAVADNSDTVDVNITVEDLAEDPQIVVPDTNLPGGFEENTAITTVVVTFGVTTEDSATISRWSLAGPDAGKLEFANDTGGAHLQGFPRLREARGRRRRQHVRGHRPGDRLGGQDGHQGRDR